MADPEKRRGPTPPDPETKGGGPDLQDLPQALHRFLELFNAREYWESHEVLEGPWREGGSDFYQGLILYASAFVHAQRGNPRGIGAQLEKAERKLAGYRPGYLGVDVDTVLAHAARCRELVERRRDEEPRSWLGVPDVPRLELDTRLVRGDEPELRLGGRERFLDTSAFRRFAADKMQKVNLFETPQMFCDVYCLEPGQAQKVHAHPGATKFYYVIEGEGTFTIGDATRTLGPGRLAWSAPDEPHGVENRGSAQLVVLVSMAPHPNSP